MTRFTEGDTVDFTPKHGDRQFTGEIVDTEIGRFGAKDEYTVRVDTPSGGGLLQTTADKMSKSGGA